jgi:outer membrane protein OmpA-like peptidoglycan-associated protein
LKKLIAGILILHSGFSFGQKNQCDSLESLYQMENFQRAFEFLESNSDWPCDEERFALLKAKILVSNYRFNEARYELSNLNSSESEELLKQINRLSKLSESRTGAILKISPKNSIGHDNLLLNIHEVSMIDTQFVVSEFPMTVLSERAFLPRIRAKDGLAQSLLTENFIEILPGSQLNDSIGAITVRYNSPFNKTANTYEIAIIDLQKGRVLNTWSAGPGVNTMYPFLRPGKLIFASDKPGGEGGFDLWSVEWDGKNFGEITNLGKNINSPANEIYPTFIEDNLIFASDRNDLSFGGFDLFRVNDFGDIKNIGLPINSSSDDLNPIVESARIRSVSSGRDAEKLRLFDISYVDTTEVFAELFGRIEIPGTNLGGKYLTLVNKDSSVVKSVILDKDGYFRLNQLKGLDDYSVSVEGLAMPSDEGRLTLFNQRGDLIADVKMNKYGAFVFKLLKPEDYYLSKESNEDESILAVDISGLFENSAQTEFVIALENSDGQIIGLTKTDKEGKFVFESVAPDEKYIIRTEVKNPNGIIRILNEKGDVIEVIHPEEQNGYVHLRLGENDRVITITDEENRIVRVSELETFNLPTVYFGSDKSELTVQSKERLERFIELAQKNPEVQIEITGHTDSRGDSDYNLKLSQKRIDSVVDYLISEGVKSSRITGKGYGESKLKNHCRDGVECSEKEHAENRRTELRLYQNQSQLEP